MSRLTKAIRQTMKAEVLNHAFSQREELLEAKLLEAGDALHKAYYGPHIKAMEKLPAEFFSKMIFMYVAIGGQRHTVSLSEKKLMCRDNSNNRTLFASDHPEAEAWLKLNDEKESLKQERKQMGYKVESILESVQTFAKLWEVWPDSKPVLEKFETKPPVAYLPAIQFDEINKQLGLPPK